MKKLFVVSMLVLSLGLLYLGCDKDDGASPEESTSLIGTWQTIKEVITTPEVQITLAPPNDLFINLIVTLNTDSSCNYQSWNGNYTAEEAKADTSSGYEEGIGSWSVGSNSFVLNLQTTYIGTYTLKGNELSINTTVLDTFLGTGLMLPVEIVMEKQE